MGSNPCCPPTWVFHPRNVLTVLKLIKHLHFVKGRLCVISDLNGQHLEGLFEGRQILCVLYPLIAIFHLIDELSIMLILEKPQELVPNQVHINENLHNDVIKGESSKRLSKGP